MPNSSKPGSKALRKGRFSQPNGIYFITIVTHQRTAWFEDFQVASFLCRQLGFAANRLDFKLLCWVVMPDHVHLLLQIGKIDLEAVVGRLKASTAMRLNRNLGRKGRFWDSGFHDHGLRNEEDIRGIARYIVGNPLRAGLVKKIGNYPYWNAIWL